MKVKSVVLALTFMSMLIFPLSLVLISHVNAPPGYGAWSPIKQTGYAVITNYFGMNVPLGQSVIATAGTTDLDVYQIEFRWHNATDAVIFSAIVPVSGPLITPAVPSNVPQQVINWATDNPGTPYLYAQNAQIPNSVGDWGVQAFFYAEGGHLRGTSDGGIISIRATSFNAIPEIPLIGTAGAAIAMLAGLGLYIKRKQK